MKALLAWHDLPSRKTHDLVEIGAQCVEVDATLEPLLRRAAPLTEFAWKYRYPGEAEEPSQELAEEAFTLAREIYHAICSRLPQDIRP